MSDKKINPYLAARQKAGLSRREVAFRVATSESSLCEYETDARPVPDDIALELSVLYEAPWLRVQHLMRNKVFLSLFGSFPEPGSKERDVLVVQKEINDVVDVMPSLIKETLTEPEFNERIYRECHEAVRALIALIYKQKTTGGQTGGSGARRSGGDNYEQSILHM